MLREAIRAYVLCIKNDLESMRRFDLALKILERPTDLLVSLLDFDEEPGLAISCDQEIDFAFFLVTKVPEFEVTEAQVVPPVHRLEQVAGDEGLGSIACVSDGSPVS